MFKLSISPEAKNDLHDIKSYIGENLGNPQAAMNVVSKITKRIKELKQFPQIGRKLSSIVQIETQYRFLECGNYMVFYRHEEEEVFVDRILYGHRDYMRILFPEMPQDE
jgi:addiction module RelE/StbE family toxin